MSVPPPSNCQGFKQGFKSIFPLLFTSLTPAVVRVLERPVQAAFNNYWTAWFTFVTLVGCSAECSSLRLPNEKNVRYLIKLEWWEKATRQNAAKLL
ncbi:hypothetical protein PHMEG_00040156 [Phytophthora megakarya]|uniref:Uncharacterized protein n=1 Tax=Phytophthora megakarya TaxID=4795 RepID=A0A225UE47_9STRA|nr:hypothetical protein PHMEG_00040156 [Phytophthora megakarya]